MKKKKIASLLCFYTAYILENWNKIQNYYSYTSDIWWHMYIIYSWDISMFLFQFSLIAITINFNYIVMTSVQKGTSLAYLLGNISHMLRKI